MRDNKNDDLENLKSYWNNFFCINCNWNGENVFSDVQSIPALNTAHAIQIYF